MADTPCSSILDRPTMNASIAPAGSAFHMALNSSVVTPATLAKSLSESLPVSTATCIWIMAFEKAVPPASASRPTDESAVAKPSICDCVRPTCAPAAPSRIAMFIMALSVVAKLLPKSTNAAPKRPKSLCAIFVTLANCAMAVAASSATMSVELPRSIMVRVKSTK